MREHLYAGRPGAQVGRENPIRLKNLLAAAQQELIERGARATAVREQLAAVADACGAAKFWEDGSRGLAVFCSQSRTEVLHLPISVDELLVVGRHFHVTPLLQYESDGSFAVLTLGKNHCRLFRGDRWTLRPVDVSGLPASEKDSAPPADHQRTAEQHGGVRQGATRQTVFTGQGGASDHAKPEMLAYCREIDRAVCGLLGHSGEPLVLAAVRHLVPIYREANHYSGLETASIDGSPDLESTHELHRRAWDIVASGFAQRDQKVLAACAQTAGRNPAGGGLHEILAAAHEGRIETLLVEPGAEHWGTFDPATLQCRLSDPHTPGAEDLLNLAVIETLRHGGRVAAAELRPAGIHEPAAAVFKFVPQAMQRQ